MAVKGAIAAETGERIALQVWGLTGTEPGVWYGDAPAPRPESDGAHGPRTRLYAILRSDEHRPRDPPVLRAVRREEPDLELRPALAPLLRADLLHRRQGQHRCGEETVNVLGFDVVIYPPGLLHAEHLELGRRQEIICFWVDTGPTPAFDHAIKLMDEQGTLRELFEMAYAEFTANRPYAAELISGYLQAIFLQARQHFTEPSREASSLVERCLGYIHENYALDFDIDDLAATVSVSPSYLSRRRTIIHIKKKKKKKKTLPKMIVEYLRLVKPI